MISNELRIVNTVGKHRLNFKKRRSVMDTTNRGKGLNKSVVKDERRELTNAKALCNIYDFSHMDSKKQGMQAFVMGQRLDEFGKYVIDSCYLPHVIFDA